MQLTLTTATGKASSKKIEAADVAFNKDYNEALIHQVVVSSLAGARRGTHKQKSRAEVRGGGKKPWRQKGTGRARAGTSRSPIWRGGGQTFAARPNDYSQKVNRKMYRSAMGSILSELVRQDRLVVVEKIDMEAPKTKDLLAKLQALGIGENALIVTESANDNLFLSARNLPYVAVCDVTNADPVSLVGFEKVLMTVDAVKKFEEVLA